MEKSADRLKVLEKIENQEKLGLFDNDNHHITLTKEDREFIKNTQRETSENSITLIKDELNMFPLSIEKHKKTE